MEDNIPFGFEDPALELPKRKGKKHEDKKPFSLFPMSEDDLRQYESFMKNYGYENNSK